MTPLVFFVHAVPLPKGNIRIVQPRGGGPMRGIERNPEVKNFARAVAASAQLEAKGARFDGPIIVGLIFMMPRGKTVKREFPTVKPDLDKLIRSVLDGITLSGIWGDDAQVCQVGASKIYAKGAPGVMVKIEGLRDRLEDERPQDIRDGHPVSGGGELQRRLTDGLGLLRGDRRHEADGAE